MHSAPATPTSGPASPAGATEPAPPRWRLRLLGGFELDDGTQRLVRLGSRAMMALLARLAMAPLREHPREELVELLWPGVAPAVSRNRLRQALSVLRSVLEPPQPAPAPVLMATRLGVRLVPGAIACDVTAFEREARLGHADAALALYRGELLPGFYDEWVLDERQRLEHLQDRLQPPPAPQAGPARLRAALPVYLTRHFLPEPLRAQCQAALGAHRLITLLGPGGSGKTRLAVELAHAQEQARPGSTAFVPLVACETRAQALAALAQALGTTGAPGPGDAPDALGALVAALRGRPMLLVLDNFEQLVPHASDLVARLAAALPTLQLLVTSRRALEVDGECTLPVPALTLLPRRPGQGRAEVLANPAVALFVDRARQVRPDFQLDAHNQDTVLDLVHALEGLPLALELAAARVRGLAPARILQLLAQGEAPRLALLARDGPGGALDARHASMERVIDWSWRQLGPDEAALLHALAQFGGGCTVDAAAAVRGIPPLAAALRLDALVACSMLRATLGPDGLARYHLYEPVREFAQRALRQAAAGTEAALRAAHRAWMLEWAESLPSTPALPALRAELANLSLALRSALADDDAPTAVRTVLALCQAHDDLVLGADALRHLEQAVLRCGERELRSRGHTLLGQLLFNAEPGDAALAHAQQGLALEPDEPALRAHALHVHARLHWLLRGHAPWLEAAADEAETLARAAPALPVLARVCVLRGAIAYAHRRDLAAGEALYRQALAIWERLGTRHAVNAGRYYVALVAQEAGRHAEALQRSDAVVAAAAELGDHRRMSQALQVRGKALCSLRRWDEASATLHQALKLAWDAMAPVELTRLLRDLPRVLAHRRRAEAAVRLQAFAAQAAGAHVGRADRFDADQQRRVRRLVAGQVSAVQWDTLRAEGAALDTAQAVALALAESAVG